MAERLTTRERRALTDEAKQWDRLNDEDLVQIFDEGEPVQVRLRRPPPKTLTIALDQQILNRLKRVARRKQVGPKDLVAMWVAERLSQERGTHASSDGSR